MEERIGYLTGGWYNSRPRSGWCCPGCGLRSRVARTAAAWLLHGNLRQRLEQQVAFPVKGQLEQARGLIQGFLDQPAPGALPPGLRLGGKLTSFEPGALYLTEHAILKKQKRRGRTASAPFAFGNTPPRPPPL